MVIRLRRLVKTLDVARTQLLKELWGITERVWDGVVERCPTWISRCHAVSVNLPIVVSMTTRIRQLTTVGHDTGVQLSENLRGSMTRARGYLKKWRTSWLNMWDNAWKVWGSSRSEKDLSAADERRRKQDMDKRRAEAEGNGLRAIYHMDEENATEPEDLLLTARNIPFLSRMRAARLVINSGHLPRLLQEFERTLTEMEPAPAIIIGPPTLTANTAIEQAITSAGASALVFGCAIAHLWLADPVHCWKMTSDNLKWTMSEPWRRQESTYSQVEAICLALTTLGDGLELSSIPAKSLGYWKGQSDKTLGEMLQPTSEIVASLLKVSYAGLHASLLDHKKLHCDAFFSLVCIEILEIVGGARKSREDGLKFAWDARRGRFHSNAYHSSSASTRPEVQLIRRSFPMGVIFQHLSRLLPLLKAPTRAEIFKEMAHSFGGLLEQPSESSSLTTWEQRLGRDALSAAKVIKRDLRSYATELLLCLGVQGLLVRQSYQDAPSDDSVEPIEHPNELAELVIDIVAKLGSGVFADTDITIALRILDSSTRSRTISGSPGPPMSTENTHRLSTIIPFVKRALQRDSCEVLEEAYSLLDTIGYEAADENRVLRGDAPFVMDSQLLSRTIRSLRDNQEARIISIDHSSGASSGGFLRWLVASSHQNPSSPLLSVEVPLRPLLVRLISHAGEKISHWEDQRKTSTLSRTPYPVVASDLFSLFLTTWNMDLLEGSIGGSRPDSHRVLNHPIMSPAVLRTISQY
ncbi:hypothetical protein FRB97_003964, partial [Tulasnella sp. 331]